MTDARPSRRTSVRTDGAELLHNTLADAASETVVLKFGGTAVGKHPKSIANILPPLLAAKQRVALVCSARSGTVKDAGTTTLLLRAAAEALQAGPSTISSMSLSRSTSPPQTPGGPNGAGPSSMRDYLARTASQVVLNGVAGRNASPSPGPLRGLTALSSSVSSLDDSPVPSESLPAFEATVDQICRDHLEAARATIADQDLLARLEDEIEWDCARLRSFLQAAQILEEVSERSRDVIIGMGERLSCRIMTAVLIDQGIDAELVTLDTIVPDSEQPADSTGPIALTQPFWDRLAERMAERLALCGDRVPVVTGYFGLVPGSLLRQVGRGYTDLCAALCAVALKASELQIWKEVDGIFTADPRKVPTARLLPSITPEEAAELTFYGSEVIHPQTMEQVTRVGINIRIKNVERPAGAGTVVIAAPSVPHSPAGSVDDLRQPTNPYARPRLPTAVTVKEKIVLINVRSNRKTIAHGFFARIFSTLDKYGIIVDLISTSEVQVSMATASDFRKGVLERVLADLRTVGEVTYKPNMAILSLIGVQLRNNIGIAGRMFTVLADGSINIEVISQGSSEINVSCVIQRDHARKALNIVHHNLIAVPPPAPSVVVRPA